MMNILINQTLRLIFFIHGSMVLLLPKMKMELTGDFALAY